MRTLLHELWYWIRKVPATIIIVIGTITVGIVTKALWQSAEATGLVNTYGWGLPAFSQNHFWGVLVGIFIAPQPYMYLLILIPIIVGGGYLEYRYGVLRMLAALFITHLAAVFITAGLLHVLGSTHWSWVEAFSKLNDVGFSNAGFGAMGAASAGFSIIWRRRARTILTLYCLVMLLFSGAIWDLTHFVALLSGFAIGPWIVRRPYAKPNLKYDKQERRNLVSIILLFNAMAQLVSKLYPGNGGILNFDPAASANAGSALLVTGVSVFYLLLAYGLYAGRRIAWRFSVALAILGTLVLLIAPKTPENWFSLILYASLLVLLIVTRKAFDVAPDKAVRKQIYRRIVLISISLLIFNALAIYALRNSFTPAPNFTGAVTESIYQIVGVSTRTFMPVNTTARLLTASISYVWIITIFSSLAALIFTTYRQRDGRSQFAAYDALLHSKGSSNIGWMARWPGMSYWVNATKTAGFAYRLENNFAIVLSDPVGSRQAVVSAFESFEEMCTRHGWRPIYYAVSEKFYHRINRQGLKRIAVGEDTIIDLPELTFSGKNWQSVRSAINRATKEGVNMRVIKLADAPVGLRDQLHTIAQGWVEDKSLPEMEFTLGTLKEAEDPEVRMHIAVDQDGTVHGMTSWMPVYQKGEIKGWTIDIMQRRLGHTTMQGVIEFLIAESATTFKQEGYKFISLSAAPLSRSGKASNAIETLLDVVAKRMEPYYGFKSLYNYKQKFNPRHETLYLCYHDEVRLPTIAIAIGKAYIPDGVIRELLASKIRG